MIKEMNFKLSSSNFTLDGGTFVTVFGILDCAALCMNTKNCVSFFSTNMRSCATSSRRFQNTKGLVLKAGIKYYSTPNNFNGYGMPCESSADCTYKNANCYKGSCQCGTGYSYQPSDNSCVTRCSKYGNTFSTYKDAGIKEWNERQIFDLSPEGCEKSCRDERRYVCITAEYRVWGGLCQLGKTPWYEVPKKDQTFYDKGWDIHIRNCDP